MRVRGGRRSLARLWAGRLGRRLCGEAGQDVVEYTGVLVLVALIVAAMASLNLQGVITRSLSCEVKQLTGGGCTLPTSSVSSGSALGAASTSSRGGGALDERQMEQALGSNRLIFACAGNGQTELGSDVAAHSQACKQQLAKLSPKAISTLALLAAVFQTEHDYKRGSGPPCTAGQGAVLAATCSESKQQLFELLLGDYTGHPGDAVIALSRSAQQLQSGPILKNEKIERTQGDVLDGFLGSLCGGYSVCLGGTTLSQAYQQAYHASAHISKITTPVLLATGIGGALRDIAGAGLKAALAKLGGGESQEMEQTVKELESQAENGGSGTGSPPPAQEPGSPGSGRGGIAPVLKGQAGVQRAIGELRAQGYSISGTEVTIKTPVGTTRIDVVARDNDGNLLFEVKNGPTARPNANQNRVFEYIRQHGGTPVGRNADRASLTAGEQIPATPVRVITYR